MSAPRFEPLTEALSAPLAGDPHDDDAEVLEQLFEPASGPPDPSAAQTDYSDHTQVSPVRFTKLQSGFQQIDSNLLAPIQLLPPDPYRKRIIIRVYSAAATDYILLANESNKLSVVSPTSGQAGRLPSGNDIMLEGHNGSVWAGFGAGSVTVSWWAVTE